jgi:hypothetical protein
MVSKPSPVLPHRLHLINASSNTLAFGLSLMVSPRAVRLCSQSLACRNRRHSLMVYCLLMLTCTQPHSRQPVERVYVTHCAHSCATLRHAQAHAPTMLLSYSVVKSFPTLPIQQSKAVMIALSVGCGSAKSPRD